MVGSILVYILFAFNAAATIFSPWIGVLAVYTIGILTPQNIWWWHFVGKRPYYWAAIPLVVGWLFATFRNKVDYSVLRSPIAASVALLWFTTIIAYYFGPYIGIWNDYHFFDARSVFIKFNKIFLVFFISICLIDSRKKAKYLALVITLSTCYLIYWANLRYLTGKVFGRLHGPTGIGISIYNDENIFAMLFVVGIPFIFYTGWYFRQRYIRYPVWLIIPFGWHAVFLTGSRGALIGLAVVTALISWRSKNALLKWALIPALVAAFFWQGGSIMHERAETITKYERDTSAVERIEAWKTAIKMACTHPITGVGLASMGQAYPYFSSYPYVRIAHNTFLQLCAENGILAGLSYLFIIFYSIYKLWNPRFAVIPLERNSINAERVGLFCLNEASLIAIAGFFVCSLFLSLQEYEIFYALLIIAHFLVLQIKNGDKT